MRRPAQLLGLTVRTACDATVLRMRRKVTGQDTADFHARTAERYAELLGHSKGMLMKAGQLLSFAPINLLVAPEHLPTYEEALARLCGNVPAMEADLALALLESELGPLQMVFAEFTPTPIAAASIGQVHAATLRDGRPVAVKIQYPEVADVVGGDLKNIHLLASLIDLLQNGMSSRRTKTDIRGMAQEVSARVAEELDYRHEASVQAEFAHLFRGHPFIHVPAVVSELCTSSVLCQELVEGLPWERALEADQELRNRWAESILRFLQRSATQLGAFHADPNPGNYLFHEDGGVSFLDFGCVKRLTAEELGPRIRVEQCCLAGDADGAWQAVVDSGVLRAYDPVRPEEVLAYWRGYLDVLIEDSAVQLTPARYGEWMRRMLRERPASFFRYAALPPVYALAPRVEIGTRSLIAQLNAAIDWRSIQAEYLMGAAPVTEMGAQEQAFFGDHA